MCLLNRQTACFLDTILPFTRAIAAVVLNMISCDKSSVLCLLDFIASRHSKSCPAIPIFDHIDTLLERLMMVINGNGHYHNNAEQKGRTAVAVHQEDDVANRDHTNMSEVVLL